MKSQQRIMDRKRELGELLKAVESHKLSAQVALEQSEKTFSEIICFIEKKRAKIQDLIRAQEKIAVSRAEGLLKQLEEEISELQRQDEELQQLSLTEDHIHFLQRYVFLTATLGSSDLPNITVSSVISFEEVAKSVTELKKHLEDFCKAGMEKIENRVKQIQILTPMTREEVLQYYCELTMDPNTAYRRLSLSETNRAVSNYDQDLPYPDHPER
ncbi:hypothetical protein KOW79_016823 [Hemibagrus wyckioides]|uniref:SPRY-associated domain-containing protein n=2 Tax=Hemibagrus wyckioides TaxID=337641 RepID=A0A9D3NER8_9TELE|nr:hypothetical protein KOW79_016823 [Hemibagrus wyckioides]